VADNNREMIASLSKPWHLLGSVLAGCFACNGPVISAATVPVAATALLASQDNRYLPGPDSMTQPGVPRGKTFNFILDHSQRFPGTSRKITVYVPAQYTPAKPACVYIGLDSLDFSVPVVLDNLIYRHEMPVTIAVGIASGASSSVAAPDDPRFNRSVEFDSMNDQLAQFVLQELLPEVERRKTPDGLAIRLSADPNDRAAGGSSTGGMGAFTLAWERPDSFRRVFTAIGTFVGMRGADRYAVLVRKTEPKPIRIFMQDGSNDEWPGAPEMGDWWMSNQTLERALKFAGYAVAHVWGDGSHDGQHANAVFPDAMRWLWKDWPAPVTAGVSQNLFLSAILQPGEGWRAVGGDYRSDFRLTADRAGTPVFSDNAAGRMRKLSAADEISDYAGAEPGDIGLAFGPDGRAYVNRSGNIVAFIPGGGKASVVAQGVPAQHLIVTYNGNLYATTSGSHDAAGAVWLVKPNGQTTQLDTGLDHPTGIAVSGDGLWLAVAESRTHWGYSYRIRPDGGVDDKQRFYWFHVPDWADDSGAGPWTMDREGRLYAATRLGIQVFDRNGRSRAILPLPGGEAIGMTFAGADFQTLYVSCADHKLYRRKLKVQGAPPWVAPFRLPDAASG
jgi:sugar lactone lactonase YvrE/enterochelin esterase-like enzyme